MSYILDALKRADAERERGAVPGLHAQPATMPLPDDLAPRTLPPWAWGLGGLALATAGMLAWSVWRGDEAPPATDLAQTTPGGQGSWGPPGGTRPRQESGSTGQDDQRPHRPGMHEPRGSLSGMPSPNASTRDQREAIADPAPQNTRPTNSGRPPRPASNDASRSSSTVAATQPAATIAQPSSAASENSAHSTRVYALHELPDHVRRSLPQLVIGGAMYSDNPGSRMLVINSQLFHEGDKLGPDVTLEEIKLKSAVLRYRTWRYGVTY